jgi:5-methylcytosine-specific restriction enzyme subunit McrC
LSGENCPLLPFVSAPYVRFGSEADLGEQIGNVSSTPQSGHEPDPHDLLISYPSELMTIWPVSTRVNKPENDDPSILDRTGDPFDRSYIEREEDLQFVRGRIDIRGNLRSALSGEAKLRCRYHELTADVDENAIILWALHLASRFGFQREDVRRAVRQAHRTLIGDVSLVRRKAADCIGRFYHRLNDDYRPMHGLCRFILEHTGPATGVGERAFLPFAVDMPTLFESFVAEWLALNLPDRVSVDRQFIAELDSNADLEFRVDLVVRDRASQEPVCVLDTKYKLGASVNEEDIQQAVAYAVRLGVDRAFLVYPTATARRVRANVGNVNVQSVAFDVASDFSASGNELLSAIFSEAA